MTKNIYPESHEIMYLKADANYTVFHLVNGKKLVMSYTLKTYVATHSSFIRIHRGTLINPRYIKSLEREGNVSGYRMHNGAYLIESRRRKVSLNKN